MVGARHTVGGGRTLIKRQGAAPVRASTVLKNLVMAPKR